MGCSSCLKRHKHVGFWSCGGEDTNVQCPPRSCVLAFKTNKTSQNMFPSTEEKKKKKREKEKKRKKRDQNKNCMLEILLDSTSKVLYRFLWNKFFSQFRLLNYPMRWGPSPTCHKPAVYPALCVTISICHSGELFVHRVRVKVTLCHNLDMSQWRALCA